MRLSIKQLRLVAGIADTGKLTLAAQQLCLSQPALSKQLSELEDRLGFLLFHRTRKAMLLTSRGAQFHARARKILAEVAALEADYGQGGEAPAKLRLGVDRVHRADWLPAAIRRFRQQHPRVELELLQVPQLLRSLQLRQIDIAIVGEVVEAAGIDYAPLLQDEMVAILPRGHALGARPWLSPQDLEGADLLSYFEPEQSYLYQRYLRPAGIVPASFRHIQSIETILALVKSGEGLSILPRRLISATDRRQLRLRPIGADGFAFTWYAARAAEPAGPAPEFVALMQAELSGCRH